MNRAIRLAALRLVRFHRDLEPATSGMRSIISFETCEESTPKVRIKSITWCNPINRMYVATDDIVLPRGAPMNLPIEIRVRKDVTTSLLKFKLVDDD